MRTVDRRALAGPTEDVARVLLGARLVRDDLTGRRVARIVELEAYIGRADRASHAHAGETARNRVMFGPPGIAYVYLVYGMYDCLNVVTEADGEPAALLIRAVEPLDGIDAMRFDRVLRATTRRRLSGGRAQAAADRIAGLPAARLASGPGLVAAAFGLTTAWTGTDLCDPGSSLRLERAADGEPAPTVGTTPRIGIDHAGEPWTSKPWRFVLSGHPSVSGRGAER